MDSKLVPSIVVLLAVLGVSSGFLICKIAKNQCPSEDIKYLFSTKTVDSVEISASNPTHIKQVITNPEWETKILFHGFAAMPSTTAMLKIKREFLANGNYNIILVDWTKLGQFPCYIEGVLNIKLIGRCTAELINVLVNDVKIKLSNIHVIGHSMGAHCAGETGNQYKAKSMGILLPHITGLDPAKPLFITTIFTPQLDPSDARFVDVIYTDSGFTAQSDDDGTVNFRMNDGSNQPRCLQQTSVTLTSLLCDHMLAVDYYAESINSQIGFYGVKCHSFFAYETCKRTNPITNKMGPKTNKNASGRYYVKTKATSPYALGPVV